MNKITLIKVIHFLQISYSKGIIAEAHSQDLINIMISITTLASIFWHYNHKRYHVV